MVHVGPELAPEAAMLLLLLCPMVATALDAEPGVPARKLVPEAEGCGAPPSAALASSALPFTLKRLESPLGGTTPAVVPP
jgi:hypothetical protein